MTADIDTGRDGEQAWTSEIARVQADRVAVRGLDLLEGLVGHHSFTEAIYFSALGRFPTANECAVFDACLVVLMEHGLNPSTVIARLLAMSSPDQLQVAMSGGLLAVGPVFAGSMEECGQILWEANQDGVDMATRCHEAVAECKRTGRRVPGFGHATHVPDDPRTVRLLEIAEQSHVQGRHIEALHELSKAVDEAYGRHLTINVTGGIAACMMEIGFPWYLLRCVGVVSRAGGLVAHIGEEHEAAAGARLWQRVRRSIEGKPGQPRSNS